VVITAAAPLAEQVGSWSPEPIERVDKLDPTAARSLNDLLDGEAAPDHGRPVDPLYHWVYFQTWPPLSSLGPDGHPHSGGMLPPLADRRRMFAGGRCKFHTPLLFGQPAVATGSVANWEIKNGRSGELLLVTVRTTIAQEGRLCLTDEQDLVYRSGPPRPATVPSSAAGPNVPGPTHDMTVTSRRRAKFDAVTLFRFSALTANSHRIHYDLPYARDVEGYAGLLVQGPLLVLSMAAMLRGAARTDLATVSFRLHQPVFSGEDMDICVSDSRTGDQPPTCATERSDATARAMIIDPARGLRASAEARFHPERTGRP
jgi:hydroxyacyl-ACP dehydratase HTD2-like protein with hotdog domain